MPRRVKSAFCPPRVREFRVARASAPRPGKPVSLSPAESRCVLFVCRISIRPLPATCWADVSALELEPKDHPADCGEAVTGVQEEIRALGWTCSRSCSLSCGDDSEGRESWPGYTERAASLIAKIWPQRKLPYAVLSAVAHGELLGLQRDLVHSSAGIESAASSLLAGESHR